MKVRYINQQDETVQMNGAVVADNDELDELLVPRRKNISFIAARVSGDNGFEITVGIGGSVGCVQYNHSDGAPPYLMAVSSVPANEAWLH